MSPSQVTSDDHALAQPNQDGAEVAKKLNPTDGTKFVVALDRNQLNVIVQALDMYGRVAVGDLDVVADHHAFNVIPAKSALFQGISGLSAYKMAVLGLAPDEKFAHDHEKVSVLVSLANDVRLSLQIARATVENPDAVIEWDPLLPDAPRAEVDVEVPPGGTTEQNEADDFEKLNLGAFYAPYIPLTVTPFGPGVAATILAAAEKAEENADGAWSTPADTMQDLGTSDPKTKKLIAKCGPLLGKPIFTPTEAGGIAYVDAHGNKTEMGNPYGLPVMKKDPPGSGLMHMEQVSIEPMKAPGLNPKLFGIPPDHPLAKKAKNVDLVESAEHAAMLAWKNECEAKAAPPQPIAPNVSGAALVGVPPGHGEMSIDWSGPTTYTDAHGNQVVAETGSTVYALDDKVFSTKEDLDAFKKKLAASFGLPEDILFGALVSEPAPASPGASLKEQQDVVANILAEPLVPKPGSVHPSIEKLGFNHPSGYNAGEIVATAMTEYGANLLGLKLRMLFLGVRFGPFTHKQKVAIAQHVNANTMWSISIKALDLDITDDDVAMNPDIYRDVIIGTKSAGAPAKSIAKADVESVLLAKLLAGMNMLDTGPVAEDALKAAPEAPAIQAPMYGDDLLLDDVFLAEIANGTPKQPC